MSDANLTQQHVVDRCEIVMAHAWMVRTFIKHGEEIDEFPELMGIVRAVLDPSRALETRHDDPQGYLHMLRKKISKLRKAAEQFRVDAPQASIDIEDHLPHQEERSHHQSIDSPPRCGQKARPVHESPHQPSLQRRELGLVASELRVDQCSCIGHSSAYIGRSSSAAVWQQETQHGAQAAGVFTPTWLGQLEQTGAQLAVDRQQLSESAATTAVG